MQSVSVITLPVGDMAAAVRFYEEGFGWQPVFHLDGIRFYQLNGLVLALWGPKELAEDAGLDAIPRPGGMALAHNVRAREEVASVIDRLAAAGGSVTRPADEPPHGGYRGYVADPDGHLWEIAWNPAWQMDADGTTRFVPG